MRIYILFYDIVSRIDFYLEIKKCTHTYFTVSKNTFYYENNNKITHFTEFLMLWLYLLKQEIMKITIVRKTNFTEKSNVWMELFTDALKASLVELKLS